MKATYSMTLPKMLKVHYPDTSGYFLCGHNIKEFDIPFICRRMMKFGIFMPNMLDIAGKKPWQTRNTSLTPWNCGGLVISKVILHWNYWQPSLNVPTPKDDIDGSMVGPCYWQDNDLPRIVHYCQKDVVTVGKNNA